MNDILFFVIFIIPAVVGYSVIIQSLKDKLRKPVCIAKRLTVVLIEGEEALAQLKYELMRHGFSKERICVLIGKVTESTEAECVRLLENQDVNYITERKGRYEEL